MRRIPQTLRRVPAVLQRGVYLLGLPLTPATDNVRQLALSGMRHLRSRRGDERSAAIAACRPTPLGVVAVSQPRTRNPQALQADCFPRVGEFQRVSVPSVPGKDTISDVNSFRLLFVSLAKAPESK